MMYKQYVKVLAAPGHKEFSTTVDPCRPCPKLLTLNKDDTGFIFKVRRND